MNSRSKNSIRNIIVAVSIAVVTMMASFVRRSVFAKMIAAEYLGLNGLFSNILGYLSLTELGIGGAITYALYKPIKDNDEEKIKSIMSEYQRMYRIVAAAILFLGLIIMPFINHFIKGSAVPHLKLYFLIYLACQVINTLFYCKRTLIICNQKEYILSFVTGAFHLLTVVVQICILVIYRSYWGYLIALLGFAIIENIFVVHMADRLYPILRDKNVAPLSSEESASLRKNIKALFLQRIGTILSCSTDSILISKYVGLVLGGLYSNYLLITDTVNKFLLKLFSAITASVGNLLTGESDEYSEEVFYHILFLNDWICGVISICMICLYQPFIRAWLGTGFLLSDSIVYLTVAAFYIGASRLPLIIFKEAAGVYVRDRYKSLIEGIVNLVFSLILVQKYGICGVIAGTIIAELSIAVWVEAKAFFNVRFNKGIKNYFIIQLKYLVINLSLMFVCLMICNFATSGLDENQNIMNIVVRLLACLSVPNVVYLAMFHKKKDFRYFVNMLKSIYIQKYKRES